MRWCFEFFSDSISIHIIPVGRFPTPIIQSFSRRAGMSIGSFVLNRLTRAYEGVKRMAEPFLSEIRIMSFGYNPQGWALCNGQLMPINQNQALFSLLGTTYGGDGRVNFALPDLRGRTPIHKGSGHTLGEKGGEQAHTLSISEIPTHFHAANATSDPHTITPENYQPIPGDALFAVVNGLYTIPANLTALLAGTVGNTGGSLSHQNMQPFLVLNFSIALQGVFPSQT
jgi:microcystin-dependent protein